MNTVQAALQGHALVIVAERAHLNRTTLWRYATGRLEITRLSTARRIAQALQLPERDLDSIVRGRRYDMSRRAVSA